MVSTHPVIGLVCQTDYSRDRLTHRTYISDLPKIASLQSDVCRHIAYADDIIIYAHGKRVDTIQRQVQSTFDEVSRYLHKWKLRINASKCETILLRTPLRFANRNIKKHWKEFQVYADINRQTSIEHKSTVRYLGIHLDYFLYYTNHVNITLQKARTAFMSLRRLFYSKHLSADVKRICYMTLIRPILAYGAPIWFNMCPSYMERLRVFERGILRACTGQYRTKESGFTKYISNRKLYSSVQTDRIDNFLINSIRNHFDRTSSLVHLSHLHHVMYPNDLYFEKARCNGFIPPEAFLYLDREMYIQDRNGVPIIYHIVRRPTDKRITHSAVGLDDSLLRFERSCPAADSRRTQREYWWNHCFPVTNS